jgi:hypothetical protein
MEAFFGFSQNDNKKEKNHYFIGNIFDDENHIRVLRKITKKLKQRYNLKKSHWNNKYFTNMIYLGYLDNETVNMYMEKIINNLFNSISERFGILTCNYTGYKLEFDKSYHKISLKFSDKDNYLEKIIVPYLYKNAILPIYNKKQLLKPSIDLLYYKSSNKLSDKNDIRIQVPTDEFKIDHISLIKGTSLVTRSGTPSLHDQMSLEEVRRFIIPFKGEIS